MNQTRSDSSARAVDEPRGDLVERYVHATTRTLPEPRRADLTEELRSTIDDMVQARTDAGEPVDEAERAALLELGDPRLLAARYAEERLQLIGPAYFLVWKRLLLRLLAWVPLAVGSIAAVVEALADDATVGTVVVAGGGAALSTAIQVAFWTTLVFAVVDRVASGEELPEWQPEHLPDLPVDRERRLADTVAAVAFDVVIAAVLVLQHFRSWTPGPDGRDVPVLDPALWTPWILFLLVVVAASIGVELWKHVRGWTWPVTLGTVATSVAFAAPVAWLAAHDRLVNPEFAHAVTLGPEQLDALNLAIAAGAVVVAAWEVGESVWRAATRRARLA